VTPSVAKAPEGNPPLIAARGIVKPYDGPVPLRLEQLVIGAGERVALGGLDAGAAETLVHLVTGAALPESGEVVVAGTNTRAIATDTAWLASLDRFGIVTDRAVLIEKISVVSNLALPLTLAIDPMTAATRQKVEALAAEVELPADRLDVPVTSLTPPERLRLHLARALAPDPALLILEHPTATLNDAAAAAAFGRALGRVSPARRLAVLALTTDDVFARASGAVRYRLDITTGRLMRRRFWQAI
jgi:ABC-type lipoprotein export system ATPase subunit